MSISNGLVPLLTFRLAKQYYALSLENVIEVAAMVAVTALPNTSPAYLGIANRHGEALAMLDLRHAFQLAAGSVNPSTLFIVAKDKDIQVGLLVDEIFQVKYIHETAFSTSHGGGAHISHIISDGGKLYQLINLSSLLKTFLSHIET